LEPSMSDEKLSLQEGIVRKKPIIVSVVGVILIYLLALRTGAAFVYFGLVSPDTCWLLKLGSIIATSGAIPRADPFSFTLPLYASLGEPQQFVVYQWLSELAFFFGYRYFNFTGLLAAAAILIAMAYLVIPLRACVRLNTPPIWSFLAVAFASTAVNLRSFIRPEIFSCLFLSIWLWLLLPLRVNAQNDSDDSTTNDINWKIVGLSVVVMVLWCNMHTGFVSGIIVLAIYAVASWLEDHRAKKQLSGTSKTLLIGLMASALASLINPYGVGLWLYMPHLFFDPINSEIRELQGIGSTELFQSLRFPLVCLGILCYAAIAFTISKNRKDSSEFLKSPLRLSSLLLVTVATFLCFTKRRLVGLCALVMLFETAHLIGSKKTDAGWPPLFWQKRISILVVELMVLILAPRGVLDLANKSVALCVPQETVEFRPPLKAMMFFNHNYDGGRIFSSIQISDMLDLYFSPKNSIFMDTRLDIFGPKIREDFETICAARQNWKELLEKYQIKWVFVGPRVQISQALQREHGWNVVYEDSAATIFKHEP
jgi:hypothetical protein